MSSVPVDHLQALGSATRYSYDTPTIKLLERFDNPFANASLNGAKASGIIKIKAPEFTSLCPLTGQPDFAVIKIKYLPDRWCVESKSLKLYLMAFRQFGEFHESCVCRICNDLVTLLEPQWLTVKGEFTPRGGIPFGPVAKFVRKHA